MPPAPKRIPNGQNEPKWFLNAPTKEASQCPGEKVNVCMRLVLVDDSEELLDLVERALIRDGHEVTTALTLEEARFELREADPDVLILDLMLPDGMGVDLCRELRANGRTFPILMLTAHGEVQRRVEGLDSGADDFLAKPFAVAELRARVRALARRGPLTKSSSVRVCEVVVDLSARRAYRNDTEVPITNREWAIMEMLLSRRGRLVERNALLINLWDEVSEKSSASLDVIMGRIRRKLGEEFVRTVRGEGYTIDA
jgi:two-component system, OmpR family, response regulator